jgi:hypothetical protein
MMYEAKNLNIDRNAPQDSWIRMLKKASSFVLASLKASTYRPRAKSLSWQAQGGRVKCDRFASRHRRLTISPACTNVASLIRDAVHLAAAALEAFLNILYGLGLSTA